MHVCVCACVCLCVEGVGGYFWEKEDQKLGKLNFSGVEINLDVLVNLTEETDWLSCMFEL